MTAPAPGKKSKAPGPKEAAAKAAREAKAAGTAPAAKKAAPPAKAAGKKATPPKDGTARTQSTISKEGTQKCEFSGETLPVTAFPTVRQADGSYVRGTVARKHLEAYRADKRAKREAAKAATEAAKAAKAKAAPAAAATPAAPAPAKAAPPAAK